MKRKIIKSVGSRTVKEENRLLKKNIKMCEEENERLREIVLGALHEANEFSSVISSKSYELIKSERYDPGVVKNIYYTAGLLAARLGFADAELNENFLNKQVKESAVIYQKFDKARYILNHLNDYRKSKIDFSGESRLSLNVVKAFEMVPFVLLQNAVKYSPPGYPVTVLFKQSNDDLLHISIKSFGPQVEGGEIDRVFERGFRGRHASHIDGSGLGLYLAKRLCDFHGIDITARRGDFLSHELGGVKYQKFELYLTFEVY